MEIHLAGAHSLKEKRHVLKSLKDRLRREHNISIAEIEYQDVWQRALLAAVTVSPSREHAAQVLDAVEKHAARHLGGGLVDASLEWLE